MLRRQKRATGRRAQRLRKSEAKGVGLQAKSPYLCWYGNQPIDSGCLTDTPEESQDMSRWEEWWEYVRGNTQSKTCPFYSWCSSSKEVVKYASAHYAHKDHFDAKTNTLPQRSFLLKKNSKTSNTEEKNIRSNNEHIFFSFSTKNYSILSIGSWWPISSKQKTSALLQTFHKLKTSFFTV